MISPYEILGIDKDATKDEIKKVFRNLAKEYHPDMNQNNDPEKTTKFLEITTAYEILMDDEKRKEFDATGEVVELNDISQAAYFNVQAAFNCLLNEKGSEKINLLIKLHNIIFEDLKSKVEIKNQLLVEISKHKKIQKKIKFKKKSGLDILGLTLKQRIEYLDKQLFNVEKSIKIVEKMSNILNEYEFLMFVDPQLENKK